MPAASAVLNMTDREIEGVALATFKQICLRNKDNRALVKSEREAYAKLVGKIGSIMDMRGDKLA